MQRKHLAAALNISTSMVCRLAKRGMPTDDVERAERWRKRHLEAGRVKGSRFDPPPRACELRPKQSVTPEPSDVADRELDMADAVECLALVAAGPRGAGDYVPALAHLIFLMSDAQYLRVSATGCLSPDLWDMIDARVQADFPTSDADE